jgi:hypothetical protein
METRKSAGILLAAAAAAAVMDSVDARTNLPAAFCTDP